MTSTATSLRAVSAPAPRDSAAERRRVARPAPSAGVHLTTRGYLVVLALLVLVVLGAFAIGRAASSHATEVSSPGPAPTQRTVQQGDTLWSIARQVAPDRDPRDVVAQIRRLNHLPTASVQAGRQILLPAVV